MIKAVCTPSLDVMRVKNLVKLKQVTISIVNKRIMKSWSLPGIIKLSSLA